MKNLKDFKKESIEKSLLISILGGKDRETTNYNGTGNCDMHTDANDNGTIDAGECVEIVKCKTLTSIM